MEPRLNFKNINISFDESRREQLTSAGQFGFGTRSNFLNYDTQKQYLTLDNFSLPFKPSADKVSVLGKRSIAEESKFTANNMESQLLPTSATNTQYFANQTYKPLRQIYDNTPMFVNPKQYEAILRMRMKKMRRAMNGYRIPSRQMGRKKIKYESRSKHAKNRKRGKDGKFISTGDDNCSDALSNSTFLKETVKNNSEDNSSELQDNDNALLETDSIGRGLSPHDLQRASQDIPEGISLVRNGSTLSTDLFRMYDKGNHSEIDEMLFEDSSVKEGIRGSNNNPRKWAGLPKEELGGEPRLYKQDSLQALN